MNLSNDEQNTSIPMEIQENEGMDKPIPLSGIEYPGVNDVLSGRGGHTMTHPGNLKFRALIDSFKPQYEQATKLGKQEIASEIVAIWRRQQPMGRFLKRTESHNRDSLWEDIGERDAIKRAAQSLRERRTQPMVAEALVHAKHPRSTTLIASSDQQSTQNPSFTSLGTTPSLRQEQLKRIKEIECEISQLKLRNLCQKQMENALRKKLEAQKRPIPNTLSIPNSAPTTTSTPSAAKPPRPLPPRQPLTTRDESNHFSNVFEGDHSMTSSNHATRTKSQSKPHRLPSSSSSGRMSISGSSSEERKLMNESIGSFSDTSSSQLMQRQSHSNSNA